MTWPLEKGFTYNSSEKLSLWMPIVKDKLTRKRKNKNVDFPPGKFALLDAIFKTAGMQ